MSVTTSINRSTWDTKWGNYYTARSAVIKATTSEARLYTTLTGITASQTAGVSTSYITGLPLFTYVHMTGAGLVVKAGTTAQNSVARVKIGNLSAL